MICGRTPEELLCDIKSFHGCVAPGLLIGAFMVDKAYRCLDKSIEANAIVETRHSLPDAIQIFTPCTVGNGWLNILDLDKFALTLYDRHTLTGIRAWLDPKKIEAFPNLQKWFMGHAPRQAPDEISLINSIFMAGQDILSSAPVTVTRQIIPPQKKGAVRICDVCQEAHTAIHGGPCLACQGNSYYEQTHA